MAKSVLISIIMLGMTSCAWLATHPQVEADLEKEAIDMAKDTEAVVEDIIAPAPAETPTPAAQ